MSDTFNFIASVPYLIVDGKKYVAGIQEPPNIPVGQEVYTAAETGMAAIHIYPLTRKKDAARIMGQQSAEEIKGAPSSVLRAYQNILDALDRTTNRAVAVTISFLTSELPPRSQPNLATFAWVLSPPYRRMAVVTTTQHLSDVLCFPVHVGKGWSSVPFAVLVDGMRAFADFGAHTSARHILVCGRTQSGKSATVKHIVNLLQQYYPRFSIVICDLKGEYAYHDGSAYYSLFGGPVVRGSGMWPGELTLAVQECDEQQRKDALIYEAWLINNTLSLLQLSTIPRLENVLYKMAELARHSGHEEALQALRRKIIRTAGITPHSPAEEILFGSRERVDKIPGAVVCDLSWLPYKSPAQNAAFFWTIGSLAPLVAPATVTEEQKVFVIEEFHLLGGELLGILLRTAARRGISVVFVSQSLHDAQHLYGGGEQFSSVIYMTPGIEHIKAAAASMFGNPEPRISLVHQRGMKERAARSFGWCAIITPDGVRVADVRIPPDFLMRIKQFNERKRVSGDSQDAI